MIWLRETHEQELFADALQFTMFFRHWYVLSNMRSWIDLMYSRELATLCGISNFSMSDLTRPDAQRLRTALSGIMNFAKFRDERQAFHLSLQGKITKQEEKCANWPNRSQLADVVELRNCEGSWTKSTPT